MTTKLPAEGYAELQKHFDVVMPEEGMFTKEEIIQLIPEFDALLPTFAAKIGSEIIDAGKNLKIIANYGVGFNNIDVAYAREKNITVTNTPYAVTEPTAEMAFALMHATARRIAECDRKLRSPESLDWGLLHNLGKSIYGKTLGIVGFGRIGQAIARRAIASGMTVVYYKRTKLTDEEEKALQASHLPLEELLKKSDFVSICTPSNKETHHLFDSAQFKLMKNDAILINTSRGDVVNEKALVKALQDGEIWGAGLDVFEFEPNISPELLKMDNVVLTPHSGTATIDARIAMTQYPSNCIIEFFKGNLISVVN